ncbi:hypothetical protein ACSNN7_01645 [Micromonospora sp. URMC 105]
MLNALFVNDDMTGRDGHRMPALPVDQVLELVRAGRPATVVGCRPPH